MSAFSKLLLSLGILILSQQLEAQGNLKAPGYLGKRAAISYNIFAFPGFGGLPTSTTYNGASSEEIPSREFYINFAQGLSFDWVVSKVIAIGMGFEHLRTGIHGQGPYKIKATGVGVQISFFPFRRKGAMAPLGPYTRLGFPKVFFGDIQGGDPSSSDFREEGYKFSALAFPFEFGYTFIVRDSWMPSIGLRYSFSSINSVFSFSDKSSPLPVRDGKIRLFDSDILKLHFGLAYLF